MSPARMSKVETAVRIVLEYHQAFNRHDVPEMMRFISDSCVMDHYQPPPDGAIYSGKEEITHFWVGFFHKSHQAKLEIEEIFGFGKRCIMQWICTWEDEVGENRRLRGVDIYQVGDDSINKINSYIKG